MTQPTIRQIIRAPQVRAVTGFSDMHIWRLERQNKFPKRFKLVEGGRAVGWFLDEIAAYQDVRGGTR